MKNENVSNFYNEFSNLFLSNFVDNNILSDIINISVYDGNIENIVQNTVTVKPSEIINTINTYLSNLIIEFKKNGISSATDLPNDIIIKKLILTKTVIESKENIYTRIITYENILSYFKNQDINCLKLLNNVISNRIKSDDIFKRKLDNILNIVNLYDEMKVIRKSVYEWFDFTSKCKNVTADNGEFPIFTIANMFKSSIINSYNDLSALKSLSINKTDANEYLSIDDNDSLGKISEKLSDYLSNDYTFFKSGYSLIDKCIKGIESPCTYIISGPSNNAKSIFLINLSKSIIVNNIDEFSKNDVVLFITLEDDQWRVLRRMIAIYGVYDFELLKILWDKSRISLKLHNKLHPGLSYSDIFDIINKIFYFLLKTSIYSITNNKLNFIIKSVTERDFSTIGISKIIDSFKMQNKHTRLILLDYLDKLCASNKKVNSNDLYIKHGEITLDIFNINSIYKIPTIVPTQTNRLGFDKESDINSVNAIGNSIQKVQYGDYVLPIRLREDLSISDDPVWNDINIDSDRENDVLSLFNTDGPKLVPFELSISKAKDGIKNKSKFHVFDTHALRILDNIDEFYNTRNLLDNNNKILQNIISLFDNNINGIREYINSISGEVDNKLTLF